MSDVTYTFGTREQIILDCTTKAPGFDVSAWSAEIAFPAVTDVKTFDADAATWCPAQLAAADSSQDGVTAFTAATMLGDDAKLDRGKYQGMVRLSQGDGADTAIERPVFPALGIVTIA